jgi:hypothetical protein
VDILEGIAPGNYKIIHDFNVNEEFLKKTFLGFSYLVPHNNNEQIQQRYYSTVFRNINIQGQRLLPQESRASLYFLKKGVRILFQPGVY